MSTPPTLEDVYGASDPKNPGNNTGLVHTHPGNVPGKSVDVCTDSVTVCANISWLHVLELWKQENTTMITSHRQPW